MSAGITKNWIDAVPHQLDHLPVTTGVYEVRSGTGEIIDIDYAGSREPFGLRSAIKRVVDEVGGDAVQIRYEQHVQYQSRYHELVLNHKAHHGGTLPARIAGREPAVRGRISPGA